MVGWAQKEALSYTCASFRRYGKANVHGCKLHRISHNKLERLVDCWLAETGQKLDLVLESGHEQAVTLALQKDQFQRVRAYLQTLDGMRRFVEALGVETEIEIDGYTYELCDLKKTYREQHEKARPAIEKELADRTEELRLLVLSQTRLQGLALELAMQEVERLTAVVAALRASLAPLDEKATDLRQQLRRATERIREARISMAGNNERRKSEVLGRILGRVVLHFDYFMAGRQERSRLVKAVFEPVIGEAHEVDVRDGTWPGPG
jgi:hypothetical protein